MLWHYKYTISYNSAVRREHLSEDDIKRNKIQLDHANLQKALSDNPANEHVRFTLEVIVFFVFEAG